jgi:hypothetical protein
MGCCMDQSACFFNEWDTMPEVEEVSVSDLHFV